MSCHYYLEKIKEKANKRKTRDKRWKVCIGCIANFPDRNVNNFTYEKAYRNYAKRCRDYIEVITKKWRNKEKWKKPCRNTKCRYKMELTILDQ